MSQGKHAEARELMYSGALLFFSHNQVSHWFCVCGLGAGVVAPEILRNEWWVLSGKCLGLLLCNLLFYLFVEPFSTKKDYAKLEHAAVVFVSIQTMPVFCFPGGFSLMPSNYYNFFIRKAETWYCALAVDIDKSTKPATAKILVDVSFCALIHSSLPVCVCFVAKQCCWSVHAGFGIFGEVRCKSSRRPFR